MFIGVLFLLFGVLLILEMTIPGFNMNYQIIWPLIIIVFAVYQMIKRKHFDIFMVALLIIGSWCFLRELHLIPINYMHLLGPILLILIGLAIIFETVRWKTNIKVPVVNGVPNYYGIFSGIEEIRTDKDFKGSTIYAIFGGVDLDLTEIKVKEKEVSITVYSIFGGTDLKLPKDVNIKVNSVSIFGGVENKCSNDTLEDRETIQINCYSIFGGTDLK